MKKYLPLLFISTLFISYFIWSDIIPQHLSFIYIRENILQIALVILTACVLTSLLYMLLTRRIYKYIVYILYTGYFLSLVYFLFFKTIGVQGVSLNPLSFVQEIRYGDDWVALMNILYFIPLGWLCSKKLHLCTTLIALMSVECIQYIFHLGIFDLGDIVANMIGVSIGYLVYTLFIKHFYRIH